MWLLCVLISTLILLPTPHPTAALYSGRGHLEGVNCNGCGLYRANDFPFSPRKKSGIWRISSQHINLVFVVEFKDTLDRVNVTAGWWQGLGGGARISTSALQRRTSCSQSVEPGGQGEVSILLKEIFLPNVLEERKPMLPV